MKRQYTKRQIREAIAYWKKQLKAGSRGKLDESLKDCNTLDEVYGELDDIMGQDKALKDKLAKLYRADNPGWKGKWNDDGYTSWRLDLIGPTFDRTMLKAIKAGVDRVLSDVKALVDRELGSSAWNLDESAGNAIVVPDENDQRQRAAFEEQLDGLFGGDAYESLLDSDRENRTVNGWVYAVSPQDLVDRDYFWEFVYDRLNEDFDPGQEIAADEMKKLVESWADEMYQTAWENFKNDPDDDYLADDDYDDGPDPGDWDNGYLYSDRDRDYYPSR